MNKIEVYKDAIALYGPRNQMDVAIEEMSELIKEIVKYKRGEGHLDNIIEEIADVTIMIDQLLIIFDIDYIGDVLDVVDAKVERLQKRLNEVYEKDRI